jgi:hypothetical protein
MEPKRADHDWKLAGSWTLANILGWAISVPAGIWVTDLVGGRDGELWIILPALLIGLAQWLALARRFSLSGWLIPAYGLGWYIGLWLGWNIGFITPEPFSLGAAGGILVGAMQWLGMRRRMGQSWVWIPTLAVSSLFGCWIGVLAGTSAYNNGFAGETLAYALGGAVAGAVMGVLSGFVLVILIRQDARRKAGNNIIP